MPTQVNTDAHGKAMLTKGVLAAIVIMATPVAIAQWPGREKVEYFCAGSLGQISFSSTIVTRAFSFEIGDREWSEFNPTTVHRSTLDTRVEACSTKTTSCFSERLPDGQILFVYALPRDLRAGMRYSVGDFTFSTSYLYSELDDEKQIFVDAIGRIDGDARRLWMIVTPRRGVTELAFSHLVASFGPSDPIILRNVSCSLNSQKGLFWGVKVERTADER